MAGHLYAITDPRLAERQIKIGVHTGTRARLLSRYRTYHPNAELILYCRVTDPYGLERKILNDLKSVRVECEQTGRKSEWLGCDILRIVAAIDTHSLGHNIDRIVWPHQPSPDRVIAKPQLPKQIQRKIAIRQDPVLTPSQYLLFIDDFPIALPQILFRFGYFSVTGGGGEFRTKKEFKSEARDRLVTITGSSKYGIPVITDQSLLLAFGIYLAAKRLPVNSGVVILRKCDLMQCTGVSKPGALMYKNVDRFMNVMSQTTITVGTQNFRVFDPMSLELTKTAGRGNIAIKLSEWYCGQLSEAVSIDLGGYGSVYPQIGKALVPLLLMNAPLANHERELNFDYVSLAKQIGISHLGTDTDHRQQLNSGMTSLVDTKYITDWRLDHGELVVTLDESMLARY